MTRRKTSKQSRTWTTSPGPGVTGFSEEFYLSSNPDVQAAVNAGIFKSGLEHYQKSGATELRSPNSFFNANYYAAQNPDALEAIQKGVISSVFEHYSRWGYADG